MAQQYSVNLGLPATPESDLPPDLFREVLKLQNAIKLVMGALDQYTGVIGQDHAIWDQVSPITTLAGEFRRIYVPTTDNLTPGQFVNLYDNGGVLTARLSTSAVGLKCRGFSTGNVTAGNTAEIILRGLHVLVTGLTPGIIYYTAAAPGAMTSAVTTQKLGYALASNLLWFDPELIA